MSNTLVQLKAREASLKATIHADSVELENVQRDIRDYDDYGPGTVARLYGPNSVAVAVKLESIHPNAERRRVPAGPGGWLTTYSDGSGTIYPNLAVLRAQYPHLVIVSEGPR